MLVLLSEKDPSLSTNRIMLVSYIYTYVRFAYEELRVWLIDEEDREGNGKIKLTVYLPDRYSNNISLVLVW